MAAEKREVQASQQDEGISGHLSATPVWETKDSEPPTSSNGAQWAKGSGETWFKLRSGTWRRTVWPAKVKDNEVWTMEARTFSYLPPALIPLWHSANTNKPAQEGTAGGPLLVLWRGTVVRLHLARGDTAGITMRSTGRHLAAGEMEKNMKELGEWC